MDSDLDTGSMVNDTGAGACTYDRVWASGTAGNKLEPRTTVTGTDVTE